MSGANMEEHRTAARIENARFLLDVAELHKSAVARRLGMSESALEQMLGRADHGEPHPHPGEAACQG